MFKPRLIVSIAVTLGLTIAVGITMYVASNASAWAQGCQTTCSNAESMCKRSGADAKECAAQYKRCMATGQFKAPKSGNNWTNLCKS
jgi:hypothetical protein